ncbi:hypothetical protein KKF61_00605, partial [Patescibacteria group bacterium]|nr:hypothetical protein [Patescibacteria group bacterium]
MDKKTLIITTYAPPMMGGPMILYNLLSKFPKDKYSFLTGYSAIKTQPHDNKYWLDCEYYFYDEPHKTKRDMINEDNAQKHSGTIVKKANTKWWAPISKIITKLLYIKRIDLLVNMFLQLVVVVRQGVKVVKQNKIDVLIGISGDGLALISAYIIHKITKKKYKIYLFDIYKGNKYSPSIRWLANFIEPLLVRNASKIIVTNEGTMNLYKKRYGNIPIEIIHNAIFSDNYEGLNSEYDPVEPYNIVFTGHIYWAQEQSVINLINAIRRINKIQVNLKLYLPKCP